MFTTIFFHDLNPVFFELGPLQVKYYGLAYALGIFIGIDLLKRFYNETLGLSQALIDNLVIYLVFGIIIGGRVGYGMFYHPDFFTNGKILRIWEGGMSFHGALIGVVTSLYIFSKKYNTKFIKICDHIAIVAPLGLLLGRIGNFINGELYGVPTDGTWGVIFPYADFKPRHPSQLYESLTEGLLLLFIMNIIYKSLYYSRPKSGLLSGVFLIGYSLARLCVEYFREPDWHLGYLTYHLTMGQLLSAPMLLLGIILTIRSFKVDKIKTENYRNL
jgi:phosphatidylglycerol:prolipoprotein diacylglycerol transferase